MNSKQKNIGIIIGVGAVVFGLLELSAKTTVIKNKNMNQGKTDSKENRGGMSFALYNMNPLNIKPSKDKAGNILKKYPGEITSRGAVHRMFMGYEFGVAAAFIHLFRYMTGLVGGDPYPAGTRLNTIEKIIRTWAPRTDPANDTEGYISYVVKRTGIARDEQLHFDEVDMTVLVRAMAPREDNAAAQYVTTTVLSDAWAIAKSFIPELQKY